MDIEIRSEDLPQKYKNFPLIKPKDGSQNSVYLLGDKYVLKLYDAPYLNGGDEIKLLYHLRALPVAHYVEKWNIKGCVGFIYEQIVGESIVHPKVHHIRELAYFLKKLHSKTANLVSHNTNIFDKESLKNLLQQEGLNTLQSHFQTIDIELKNDGIIHGDIFPDNVKWHHNALSGVYDFSEACNGDFIFDVAVVASSWCFDDDVPNYEKIYALLCAYGLAIPLIRFKEYIKYALVYYATKRYCDGRAYQELLKRLENI